MNNIQTEKIEMEKEFPNPPSQEWYDDYHLPDSWKLIEGCLKGKKVLDIGCASGWLGYHAQKQGAIVICTDIFRTYVHPAVDFITANKEDLPFRTSYFDFVLTSDVLHHGDLVDTCTEAYRVLKQGGEFISLQEPCIPNDTDEEEYLKKYCAKELTLGIDEHRPNWNKYMQALTVFRSKRIFKKDLIEAPPDYDGAIVIQAWK